MTQLTSTNAHALAHQLRQAPVVLGFGTSGRRGRVADLTQLEVYLNARAELEYLQSLSPARGGIAPGSTVFMAHDLRPSSTEIIPGPTPRGGLAQAIQRAIRDAGHTPINLGPLPTPALAAYALSRGAASFMVTGSHIPFDRNGYKTNSAVGELLKTDEAPINELATAWRERLLGMPFADSLFDEDGMLREAEDLLEADPSGAQAWLARHREFFGEYALAGLRVLVYQHSAVGRDLLVEILLALGATVVPIGRSESFVPIDTEAIDDETLAQIEALALAATGDGAPFDAVVSTDGDSDRPLLIGLESRAPDELHARFFGGDLVGMLVAEALAADAVVVPVSCNDAIDRGPLAAALCPRTRIGSPWVIAGMQAASAAGRARVCGWEANGGFLLGADLQLGARRLSALPTRDAFLPIVTVLGMARARGLSLGALFDTLPRRFSRAGLLRDFPRATSLALLAALGPGLPGRARLGEFFSAAAGFGPLLTCDDTDGLRMRFENGDVAHIRPSGNADELRLYACADSQSRADEILRLGLEEPGGILRRLAAAFIPQG
jgi:phosphomannomutase